MADTLKLEIITPEEKTFSEDVDFVTLPGVDGEMGIYPNPVSLMTQVQHGEIAVKRGGEEFFLAIGEGFAKITGDNVAILTDMAIRSDAIDEAEAEEARKQAETRLAEEQLSDEQIAAEQAVIANSVAQLNVKRRRSH